MTASTTRIPNIRHGEDPLPVRVDGTLAATQTPLVGWLLGKNASGYVEVFTTKTGLTSFGASAIDQDSTGFADGKVAIEAWAQVIDIAQSTAGGDTFVEADAPAVAYGVDNATIGKIATGRSPAGIFLGINTDTGKAKLWVGPAAAAMASALITAGGDVVAADLASTANGKGASLVGIEDAAAKYTATTVEAALAEVKLLADAAVPLASVQYVSNKTLVAGDVTISTGVTVTANSVIVPLRNNPDATAAHWGLLTITNRVNGGPGTGGFHIHSSNASDVSVCDALIIG